MNGFSAASLRISVFEIGRLRDGRAEKGGVAAVLYPLSAVLSGPVATIGLQARDYEAVKGFIMNSTRYHAKKLGYMLRTSV